MSDNLLVHIFFYLFLQNYLTKWSQTWQGWCLWRPVPTFANKVDPQRERGRTLQTRHHYAPRPRLSVNYQTPNWRKLSSVGPLVHHQYSRLYIYILSQKFTWHADTDAGFYFRKNSLKISGLYEIHREIARKVRKDFSPVNVLVTDWPFTDWMLPDPLCP